MAPKYLTSGWLLYALAASAGEDSVLGQSLADRTIGDHGDAVQLGFAPDVQELFDTRRTGMFVGALRAEGAPTVRGAF